VGTAALENYSFSNEALKKIRAIIPSAKHDMKSISIRSDTGEPVGQN
jgi:hypothetical protein